MRYYNEEGVATTTGPTRQDKERFLLSTGFFNTMNLRGMSDAQIDSYYAQWGGAPASTGGGFPTGGGGSQPITVNANLYEDPNQVGPFPGGAENQYEVNYYDKADAFLARYPTDAAKVALLAAFGFEASGDNAADIAALRNWLAVQYSINANYDPVAALTGGGAGTTTTPTYDHTVCANGTCTEYGSNGQMINQYPDQNYKPGFTTVCEGTTCRQVNDNTGQVVATWDNPSYEEPDWGPVLTDEYGNMYQIGPNNEYRPVGTAGMGATPNMPTEPAGWGFEWVLGDPVYNPVTKKMERQWMKVPLGWEAALAQAQYANQPVNWLNVALLERQMKPEQQVYKPTVGEATGELVHAAYGAPSRYDLQAGQSAYGITPAGWLENWQSGYPTAPGAGPAVGGGAPAPTAATAKTPLPPREWPVRGFTGGFTDIRQPTAPTRMTQQLGQAPMSAAIPRGGPWPTGTAPAVTAPATAPGIFPGGYYTSTPSAQWAAGLTPSQWEEMQGWFGSGLAGQTYNDWLAQIQHMSAPSGGGTRLTYR